jgi:hypothetical protein
MDTFEQLYKEALKSIKPSTDWTSGEVTEEDRRASANSNDSEHQRLVREYYERLAGTVKKA